LNVNLVRLPDELIDYTILHELVHTRIKNHGQRFWDQLDRLLGDAKQLDQALNEYTFLLFQ
jgi:predicted metal-dependent hydrolase